MPKLICFFGGVAFGAGLLMCLAGVAPFAGAIVMVMGGITIALGLHAAVLNRQ